MNYLGTLTFAQIRIPEELLLLRHVLRILGFSLFLCCIGCTVSQNGNRTADTRFLGEEQPVQESWDVNMKIFRKDKVHAVVTAGYFAEYKKNDIITRHLEKGVTVAFFDSIGTVSSTLTADKGTVHDNNDVEAFDNVVIVSGDATLTTNYIKRFADKKKLWSDKYVVIKKPNETVRGYGFESDESLKNYTIFKASGETDIEQ